MTQRLDYQKQSHELFKKFTGVRHDIRKVSY